MPEVAVVETAPTFSEFRAHPDKYRAGVEAIKTEKATETAPPAKEAQLEPTSEPVAGSDPDNQQSSKFEQRKAEMQRQIDAKRKELGEIERALEAKKAPASEAKPAEVPRGTSKWDGTDPDDPEPNVNDTAKYHGPTAYEDYLLDKGDWRKRKQERVVAREKQEAAQAESARTATERYKADLRQFEDRGSEYASQPGNEDYPELVKKFRETNVSPELEAVVVYSGEDGPAFLHHLLKQPELLKKLDDMNQRAIDRLSGFFEEKFKLKYADKLNAGSVAERPKSQAPAPGTILNGRGAAPRGEPKSLNDITSLDEARKLVRRS